MKASHIAKMLWCAAILAPSPMLCSEWAALGPFGGSAAVVATDPHASKTVVVGTRSALLFRSRDAGESWTPLPFPAQLRAILHTLVIDPRTPGVYLAGLSSDLPQYSGMLRSADSGATWQQVPALRGLQVRAIAFFRGNAQILAAGTDRGVFRSSDGGLAWSRISPEDNLDLEPVVSIAFDPNDSTILYAGTPHLPWKTADDGATWRSIYTGMIDDSDVFSIVVNRNRPEIVFAGACSGVYRSSTGGATWTRSTANASGRTYVIAQDPQHENVLFVGTAHGMIRSGDGGQTWQELAPYATHSIAFDLGHLGRIFIATDDEGILRSENGGKTWQAANNGFCNRRLISLAMAEGALYTSTSNGPARDGLFRLAKGVKEWEKVPATSGLPGKQPIAVGPMAGSGDKLFAATTDAVMVSADGGSHWKETGTLGPSSPITDLLALPWAPSVLLASTSSGLFISENDGDSWASVELPAATAGIRALRALTPPWIAAMGESGILLSADGKHWMSGASPAASAEVLDIIATDARGLWAATSEGLQASTDLGHSWHPTPGEFKGNTVQALACHPLRTSMLFAAQFGVLRASQDGGRSWSRISPEGWPVTSVKQLIVAPGTPDRLFILTSQQGVFVLDLDTDTDEGAGGR